MALLRLVQTQWSSRCRRWISTHGFLSSEAGLQLFCRRRRLAQAGFGWSCLMRRIMGHAFTGDEQARLGLFWQTPHGNSAEFAGLRGRALARPGWWRGNGWRSQAHQWADHDGAGDHGRASGGGVRRARLIRARALRRCAETLSPAAGPQEIGDPVTRMGRQPCAFRSRPDLCRCCWHGDADDVVPPG